MADPTITFEALDAAALAARLEEMFTAYVRERIAAGDTEREARKNAAASHERYFPNGTPTPDHHVGRVLSDEQPVGHLWVGPADDDPRRWWVFDIEVDEDRRGQGLGRRTMLLAQEIAREHGATSLGLNVFAGNRVARQLYASLGFEESSVVMRKSLSGGRS